MFVFKNSPGIIRLLLLLEYFTQKKKINNQASSTYVKNRIKCTQHKLITDMQHLSCTVCKSLPNSFLAWQLAWLDPSIYRVLSIILAPVTTLSATAGNQTELLGAKLLSDFALSGFSSNFSLPLPGWQLLFLLLFVYIRRWRYLAVRSRGGEWGPL